MPKKIYSAQFALECVIEEEKEEPSYILRDVQGHILTYGSIDAVTAFLGEAFSNYKAQLAAAADSDNSKN